MALSLELTVTYYLKFLLKRFPVEFHLKRLPCME